MPWKTIKQRRGIGELGEESDFKEGYLITWLLFRV